MSSERIRQRLEQQIERLNAKTRLDPEPRQKEEAAGEEVGAEV